MPIDDPWRAGLTTTPPANWRMMPASALAAPYASNASRVNECQGGVGTCSSTHTALNRCLSRHSADAIASEPV